MAFLNKILLPVDFSDRCLGAGRFVEALAIPQETEVFVLHVNAPASYPLSPVDFGGPAIVGLDSTAEQKSQLDSFLADELSAYRVRRVLLDGDPARNIVQFAHDNQVDLITMPTRGYGLFRRFLLGSVTAKVLHDADCPVWTGVHLEEAPEVPKIQFRNIVVALDLSATQSTRTLAWARCMALRSNARLVVAHAYPSMEGRGGEYFDPNWRDLVRDRATEEINKMQQNVGTNADLCIEGGDVPHVVCSVATREKADLLVIGRGAATGVFGRLHANAYAIIRQSPCPVVSV